MSFFRKNFYKLTLFALAPLYIIATILVGMVSPLSVMAFDAPGSEDHWVPWVFILSVFGLALFLFISDILIILFALRKKRKPLIYSLLLPFPFVIILILIFTISPTF
jgi:hypothetical protein